MSGQWVGGGGWECDMLCGCPGVAGGDGDGAVEGWRENPWPHS